MVRASNASVEWDEQKKRWEVHIQFGAEVIKRPISKFKSEEEGRSADKEALKSEAVAIARDEGYDVQKEQVTIQQ
jgi:hypothetical protein